LRSVATAVALALSVTAGAAPAQGSSLGAPKSSAFCDRADKITATQQDRLLRFAAVVREELASGGETALISRSGLDLSRFGIRYSHAAVAWRAESGVWAARQLYYACDEGRPRIFDQGLAGFVVGIDDPALGYVAIVRPPPDAARTLRRAALDTQRALRLLAASYSANAYPFSLRHQNCNQWIAELLAVAWGRLDDADLRAQAQRWLQQAGYTPEPVDVGSHALMFAALFVPHLHLDDHPLADREALKLRVSLPAALETFVRERWPDSERVEICSDGRQVVVHRGWTSIPDGCRASAGDRTVPLD